MNTDTKTGERDYVLGTHDAEIERLGLQHRVWRRNVLDVWQRVGIDTGHTVIDLGAGPGYATLDLAEVVGSSGKVIAVERSQRFIEILKQRAVQQNISNITTVEADVVNDAIGNHQADYSWTRWLLCFVNDPQAVLKKLHASLKPGGIAVFHEYIDYGTYRLTPDVPAQTRFLEHVVSAWRKGGGEPNIARQLPNMREQTGFEVVDYKPLVFVVSPKSPMWQWPVSFVEVNLKHLADTGQISVETSNALLKEIMAAVNDDQHLFVTPMVLEIVARKR